jgi:hypothetical protein
MAGEPDKASHTADKPLDKEAVLFGEKCVCSRGSTNGHKATNLARQHMAGTVGEQQYRP